MRRTLITITITFASLLAVAACDTGSKTTPTQAPAPTPSPSPATAAEGVLRVGAPIEASTAQVALADVAKTPNAYLGKTFATTGTVTAVCQHMGCWMEIKDENNGEAHIKMAGHAFLVPKTASGRKARVLAKLVKAEPEGACDSEGHEGTMSASAASEPPGAGAKPHAKGKGCRAEAEAQLGRPLAKLELVAEGVELM